jgi:hypothetical protein
MNPLTEIKSIPESLHLFIPVNITQIRMLYTGAFIRFKNKEGKLYYGGFFNKIIEISGKINLEISTDITYTNKINIPLSDIVQLWKKIDFCYFELNKMESISNKIIQQLKILEDRINILENKVNRK